MKDKIVQWCERIIEWSLYVLVFGVTFSKGIAETAASVAITAWVFKKIISREFKIVHTDLNYAIFGFFLVSLVSLINVINTDYAFVSVKGFIGKITEYVLLYFVIVDSVKTKRQFRNIIGVILFSCLLIGIDGIFQKFFGFDFMRFRPISGTRLTASFKNPNHFGGWLSMVLPITVSLFLFGIKRPKWLRIGFGLLSVLLFICLVLAGSRGAWLGFVGALLLIMGILKSKKLFLITLICILIMPFTVSGKFGERVTSIFNINNEGPNIARITLWKETLVMIKDRPLLGRGVNTFMSNWSKYGVGKTWGHPYYPHNCYLHMVAETGLIGLAMFMWIIIMLFKSTINFLKKIKLKTEEDSFYQAVGLGLLGGITACLIHSFVDNNLYVVLLATFFWILLGLVNAEKRIYADSTT